MPPIYFLVIAAGLAIAVLIAIRVLPKKTPNELPPHMRALCIPCKLCPFVASVIMLIMLHQFYVIEGFALFFAWLIAILIILSLAMSVRYFKKNWGNMLLLILNFFLSYAYLFFLVFVIMYPGS